MKKKDLATENRHVCIIMAKDNNNRCPGKNFESYGGSPACEIAADTAHNAGFYDNIIISTDRSDYSYGGKHKEVCVVQEDPDPIGEHRKMALAMQTYRERYAGTPDWDYLTAMYGCAVLWSPAWLRHGKLLLERGYIENHKITRVECDSRGALMVALHDAVVPDATAYMSLRGINIDIDYPSEAQQLQQSWHSIDRSLELDNEMHNDEWFRRELLRNGHADIR